MRKSLTTSSATFVTVTKRTTSTLLMAGWLALASASAFAAPADDAAAATVDLFAKMSARDLAAVARYVPTAGFGEISPGASSPHQLDTKAFEGLFASSMAIDLRASDVQARALDAHSAIVTGVRIGAITAPGATPVEGRVLFTTVWTQNAGQWQLQHIHLSAIASPK